MGYAQCACVFSVGKMADPMYGYQGRERSISATEQFQRKRHKPFYLRRPSAEYVTAFSGRRDAFKVRCDLTYAQAHRHDDYRTKFKVQSLIHIRPTMAWQKNKTKLLDKVFGIQKYVCTSTSEGVDDTVWIHNRSVTVNKVVEI